MSKKLGDILGIYYLHENGDIIWKPRNCFVGQTVEQYLDYPQNTLIVRYWEIPSEPPADPVQFVTGFLLDAIFLSKDKSRTLVRASQILFANGVGADGK